MKNRIIEASILALGILLMGLAIKSGIKTFSQRDRVVNVKGLAEMEVQADKVIWPLVYKDVGNDLPSIYNNLGAKNQTIVSFLKSNGITDDEISISAPKVIDFQAERYSSNVSPYRYNITAVITVSSDKVDLVRKLISEQGELLKQGIAVSGGDYEYNVQFMFTKLNEIKPKMIEDATKNAREAAVKFAEDSDSKLGKIKSASQGLFSITDRDENTPHIKNVRVVSTIEYYLKD
ncbi:MAG TPA: SIMPL domain-containing protein [Bacteroidales bacterium]|nr:SIMPL domain-containing protein [Bacteroidales bacterium]